MALLIGSIDPRLVSTALFSSDTSTASILRKPPALSAGLLILPLYFLVTIAIGWVARRQNPSANAYLNASRSLPLWIVVAAYLAANCGALEIVGLSAMAAQYGVQAFNFYWIGAIPAMVFLANWMMPIYRRSGVRSVPEYLEFRYGPGLRLLNACVLAITMLLLAGISLYAMAQVLLVVIGLSFSNEHPAVCRGGACLRSPRRCQGDHLQRSVSTGRHARGSAAGCDPQPSFGRCAGRCAGRAMASVDEHASPLAGGSARCLRCCGRPRIRTQLRLLVYGLRTDAARVHRSHGEGCETGSTLGRIWQAPILDDCRLARPRCLPPVPRTRSHATIRPGTAGADDHLVWASHAWSRTYCAAGKLDVRARGECVGVCGDLDGRHLPKPPGERSIGLPLSVDRTYFGGRSDRDQPADLVHRLPLRQLDGACATDLLRLQRAILGDLSARA